MDHAQSGRGEDHLAPSGYLQAMTHVGARLRVAERPQVVPRRDPLRQLAQRGPLHQVHQLGLPDQDDLQQLVARRLDVRQQAQLLEHFHTEVLRLVDDDDGTPPARVRVEQRPRQRVDEDLEARRAGRVGHAQLVADGRQQLDRRQPRREDHRHVDLGRELVEQRAAHGRLAGPDLTRQLDEAPALEPVHQVGERLPVPLAQEEVARVGREGKRPLGQPEMCSVHAGTVDNGRRLVKKRCANPPSRSSPRCRAAPPSG